MAVLLPPGTMVTECLGLVRSVWVSNLLWASVVIDVVVSLGVWCSLLISATVLRTSESGALAALVIMVVLVMVFVRLSMAVDPVV